MICSDCTLLAAYDGCGRGSADMLSRRLQAPVAGLTAIPHNSHNAGGLSIVQVEPCELTVSYRDTRSVNIMAFRGRTGIEKERAIIEVAIPFLAEV